MAARTRTVASSQAADGRVVVGGGDSAGGLALRAADGLPLGLLVTTAAPAGDNVIVAGTTSWHQRTQAMHGWIGGCWATHPARPGAIAPGGRSRRVGGDRHASSRR